MTSDDDSDHGNDVFSDHDVITVPCSVYATPLSSPLAPGLTSDSEHFTYKAANTRVETSGQCHQPSHAVNNTQGLTQGEMNMQNVIQQQQKEITHPSISSVQQLDTVNSVTISGRSQSEDNVRVRSPAQSCQEPRPINIKSQQQQSNNSESSKKQADIDKVKQETSSQDILASLENIPSESDICSDKSDELIFISACDLQQQSIDNNTSSGEKDNHFNPVKTIQQPFKSVTTTTTQNNSSSTSYQYEDKGAGEHFRGLRRINSLLGRLEQQQQQQQQLDQESERGMNQPQVRNSFDNLCWIFPRVPSSDFHTI